MNRNTRGNNSGEGDYDGGSSGSTNSSSRILPSIIGGSGSSGGLSFEENINRKESVNFIKIRDNITHNENEEEINLIHETVYGITRNLYQKINDKNMRYFSNEVSENLFNYVVDTKYTMEKYLYIQKYNSTGDDFDGSDLMSRSINERIKGEFTSLANKTDLIVTDKIYFNAQKVYDTLSDILLFRNEISRVNNTTVEHFITFVDGAKKIAMTCDEINSNPSQACSLADELANAKICSMGVNRKRPQKQVDEDETIYLQSKKPSSSSTSYDSSFVNVNDSNSEALKAAAKNRIDPNPLTWMFPLPFYCIADVNSFDIIFTQITSLLAINVDKYRNKNDVYYRIWENKKDSCIFFVNEIGCRNYMSVDNNLNGTNQNLNSEGKCTTHPLSSESSNLHPSQASTSSVNVDSSREQQQQTSEQSNSSNKTSSVPNTLKQFFVLSSMDDLNNFSFIQLIFDAMQNSLNIHYTEKMPYTLMPFNQCRDLTISHRINRTIALTKNNIIKFIHEKLPPNVVYVLFGQCIDPKFTENDFKFWIGKNRLPQSTFLWRRINCAFRKMETMSGCDKVQIVILLKNNTKLINYSCSIYDVDEIYEKIETDVLPSVCLLRNVDTITEFNDDFDSGVINPHIPVHFQRIFQHVHYMKLLKSTIIVSSSLWPSSEIDNLAEFANYEQQLIMPEVLTDFFKLNYNLEVLEPHIVIHKSKYAELFIIKFRYFVLYVFGTTNVRKVGQNFQLNSAILKYLFNLRAIKNHNLVENLQYLFDLLP